MKTILYERHCKRGAKMVDFGGWEMPLQYKGIIQEHIAVRNHVGMFDVSHMGRVQVEGKDAEKFLDYLSTNKISDKADFSATYTVWCYSNGTCVDDVIIYKQDSSHFFVVVNAANRQKDLDHLTHESLKFDVRIISLYQQEGILSFQGPSSKEMLHSLFPAIAELKMMHFCICPFNGSTLILSRTGYTGELGYEVYAPLKLIEELWDQVMHIGGAYQLEPIGLGARDTLRLEMGYALYGHELSENIAASESVSAWTIKWNKEDFLGKSALEKLQLNPKMRHEYGVLLVDKGIARAGYDVYINGKQVGCVTSGTHSPSMNCGIAIVLVEEKCEIGDVIAISIRKKMHNAQIVKLPFYVSKNSL